MTTKHLILVHSGIYALFALALLFIPEWIWPQYGLTIRDADALFLSQHNSIFLGGIAAIGFALSGLDEGSAAQRSLLHGLIWTNALGVGLTLYACFSGIFSGFGWSDPAFFATLVVLLGSRLRRPQSSGAATTSSGRS